ncbi:hypothetical protein BH23GEM11_BH23GEM11_07940 [soil metagenome]
MPIQRSSSFLPFLAAGSAAMLVALLLAALSLVVATPATGSPSSSQQGWCAEAQMDRDDHCELRALSTSAGSGPFSVSGMANGSISVEGWDGREVRVTARIIARNAGSARAAAGLAESVELRTGSGQLQVAGPRSGIFRRASWSVDLRIQVPEGIDLDLSTTNGAVRVTGVGGAVSARTTNGALSLEGARGSVTARTTNGSVTVALSGGGSGNQIVDLRSTNGSIDLRIPASFGSRVEARTSNGRIASDFPLEMEGRRQNQASGTLGDGSGTITLRTTNGTIRLQRGS